MNLSYLETFVEVVESGSISEYSKRSGLSLSTVSNRLDRTEEFFDMPLLVRGKEGVRLTDEGEYVLTGVTHVLGHLESIKGHRDGSRPRVALIGGNGSLSYLKPVIGKSGNGVLTLDTDEGMRLVKAGGIDVGLVSGDSSGNNGSEEGDEVCRDEVVCLVPSGSSHAERGAMDAESLTSAPLIGIKGSGEPVQDRVLKLLADAGVSCDDLTYVYEAVDPVLQVDLVSRSLGVALSTRMVYEMVRERYPDVEAIPLTGVESGGPTISAISNNGDPLTALRTLVE